MLAISRIALGGDSSWILEVLTGEKNVHPQSYIYQISQSATPVRDMDSGEAIFLGFSVKQRSGNEVAGEYEGLLSSWRRMLDCIEIAEEKPITYGSYDRELAEFVERIDEERAQWLESPCFNSNDDKIGNPWLSYGRPLNGYPVTVDTQFDDETLIGSFKLWLTEKRKAESANFRRPYNEKDYRDWEHYKIREIFDLETWAVFNDIKILDSVISNALWPDAPDHFSPIDVLRTTARKKMKDVFRFETSARLWGQLTLIHGENFLEE